MMCMTTTTKPTKVQACNGYFETWERPCGHRYRITTEYLSGQTRKVVLPKIRRESAARPCRQCAEVTS